MTTADKGRAMSIYIDNVKIADYIVPSSYKTADEKGFFNIEFRIPDELLRSESGSVKEKLVFKAVASSSTLLPGLYYIRLLKDYKDKSYVWNCSDWKTGDSGRVSQDKFTYDTENNTITIKAGTGDNNVCLSLDYQNVEYTITSVQKYLVVLAENISIVSGKNYLWWLNGINKASSISPSMTRSIKHTNENGSTSYDYVVAWDMNTSDLNGNNVGDVFSISQGSTIFGLTSTTGTTLIKYIGFVSDVNAFIDEVTSITPIENASREGQTHIFNINGQRLSSEPLLGLYIKDGKKYLKREAYHL